VPAVQLRHALALEEPVDGLYVPALQLVQLAWATFGL